jgi:hypothetical protein
VNDIVNNCKVHHNYAWTTKDRLQVGYYYYDRYKKPITLSLSAKRSKNTIELSTPSGEKMIISFKDTFLQGSWVPQGREIQSKSLAQIFIDSVINIFKGEKALAVNAQLNSKFIDLDYHVKEENLKFQKLSIAQPICRGTFSIETVWPKGPDQMDYLRKILREIIGTQAPTSSIEEILEYEANIWRTNFFNESDKDFKDELEYLTQEHSDYYDKRMKEEYLCPYFDHCDEIQIYCCYLSPTILSIEKYCQYEIGGRAHGSYDSYFTVVDLVNKKRLLLRISLLPTGSKNYLDYSKNLQRRSIALGANLMKKFLLSIIFLSMKEAFHFGITPMKSLVMHKAQ